jgi:tetratricopeptide (TPR) repeat protein
MASTGDPARTGPPIDSALETRAGSLLGTPMYMAPEQIRGGRADERSEIFSLGIIGYELLAGRSPYRAKTLDELFAQIEHEPIPALPDAIPTPIGAALGRALAKDPEQRHPTMSALRDELRAVRQRLYARRTPSWPWLAAALLATIAAAATVYLVTRPEPAAPVRPGDRYVQRALEEYDVFYNDKALSSLRAATRHDPDHPLANAYLILFGHAGADEQRDALVRARRALETLDPAQKKEKALLDAAVALVGGGPEPALAALRAAGATGDRELDFWTAELAYRAGRYADADAGFRALLAADDPRFRGRIYDHYSAVLLYFDKIDEALEVGRAYAEAFPGEADAIGVYATTLAAAGRYDRALELAREARDLNEGEDTLAGLAKVHAYRGELDRARALYAESARRAHPGRRVLRLAALGLFTSSTATSRPPAPPSPPAPATAPWPPCASAAPACGSPV